MTFSLPSSSVSSGGVAPTSAFLHAHVLAALATARRLLVDEGTAQRVVREALVDATSATGEPGERLRERVVGAAVAVHRAGPAHEPEIARLLPRFQADGHHVRPRAVPGAPPRVPDAAEVRAAIGRLPREHRLMLLLHDVEGLTLAAAATCLGIEAALARARLHQARLALCELLAAAP